MCSLRQRNPSSDASKGGFATDERHLADAMGRERGNHRGRESSDVAEEIESGASLNSGAGESSTDREARGGIRLTWRESGNTASANWSEPRARALFPRLATG